MMMKMNMKTLAIVAVVILVLFFVFRSTSGYLTGFPVQTNISDESFANFFSRMTKLGPELRCNPGSADKDGKVMSSYYTGGLLPGGYCDDQKVVKSSMDWKFKESKKPVMLGD
jgi:hypothetical protein